MEKSHKKQNHGGPGPKQILKALETAGVPQSLDELLKALKISEDKDRKSLLRRLKKMVVAGQIIRNRRGEYCLLKKLDALIGKVTSHKDGFGFLIPDDGSDDLYLPFHVMRSLLDGDRIAAHVSGTDKKGRRRGELVEILERGKTTVVGSFHKERGICYVLETAGRSSHQYLIANKDVGGARDGQMVKIEIVAYPTEKREAQGKVIDVFGAPDDAGMITRLAIESFDLRHEWPPAVTRAAEAYGAEVSAADKETRVDLREMPLVTIDGADARDFDDALFAEPAGGAGKGWRLVVAIADVSNYVRHGEPLDDEARKRGTSTYFPDQVVPMLPEALSNGLCSLNPDVDRLCLVCDMQVSNAGKVGKFKFYKGVMRSHARLTYHEVDEAVGQQVDKTRKKLTKVLPQLDNLYGVYRALAKERKQRGALDMDLPEVRITMDADHQVDNVAPYHRNDAHRLVEECMIAANVQAARMLSSERIPGLYRVHPQPGEERFDELRLLLQELGIKVTAEARIQPKQLNKVLVELRKRPDFAVMATSVLRTMAQALYQPKNEGHFGLALDAYAHFTSPIRRYPDLLVHRAITHILAGGKAGGFVYKPADMEQLGASCSRLERQAEAASRHVESRYKCLYISKLVGQELEGVITGVTHFGLFVMLSDFYVDGLVHVTSLKNDYYHAEHGNLRLTGERTGVSYGLGDVVRVRVGRVDVEEARVDLEMI